MSCYLCLQDFKNVIKITTTCKHTFCLDCLSKLNKCPYCRKDLNVKKYFEKEDYNYKNEYDFYYTSPPFN